MSVPNPIDRRRMLRVIGAGGSTAALLACGGRLDTNDDGTPSDPDPAALDPGDPGDPGTDSGTPPGEDTGGPVTPGSCGGRDTAPLTDVSAPGMYKIYGSGRSSIIIGHDDGGLFAMSGACSHSGCKLAIRATELYCNCHNGHFHLDGSVISVPRNKPQTHYAASVCAGRVFVDTATVVAAATRTPAP